jgi:hypothetical protein
MIAGRTVEGIAGIFSPEGRVQLGVDEMRISNWFCFTVGSRILQTSRGNSRNRHAEMDSRWMQSGADDPNRLDLLLMHEGALRDSGKPDADYGHKDVKLHLDRRRGHTCC